MRNMFLAWFPFIRIQGPESIVRVQVMLGFLLQRIRARPSHCLSLRCFCMMNLRYRRARRWKLLWMMIIITELSLGKLIGSVPFL